jgi:hypothetical protein
MSVATRLKKLEAVYTERGDFDPPEPEPEPAPWTVDSLAEFLRNVFSATNVRWVCPQLWTALRDWQATKDAATVQRLTAALTVAIEEYDDNRPGRSGGLCNAAGPSSRFNYHQGQVSELPPSPPCPRCGVVHSDDLESLRLARERNIATWTDRAAARARWDQSRELAQALLADREGEQAADDAAGERAPGDDTGHGSREECG